MKNKWDDKWLQPPQDEEGKRRLNDAIGRMKESLGKLPLWAKSIVVKHMTHYLEELSSLKGIPMEERAEALATFMSSAAPQIVSKMIEEVKKEAERRGYGAIRSAVKEASHKTHNKRLAN